MGRERTSLVAKHTGRLELEEVANELYGLTPEKFVSRRQELPVKERRKDNRLLAGQIEKFCRPTIGAGSQI